MKIQNINKYINFKGNSKPVKNDELAKNNKYDVIEIKHKTKHNSNISKKELDNIKKDISTQINKETNTNKIAKIKNRIDNNNYKIDVDEIVRRLLDN